MSSKYGALADYLRKTRGDRLKARFREIERVVGSLPPAARNHRAWWSNNASHTHARNGWLAAGWRTSAVDMQTEALVFLKTTGQGRSGNPGETRHGLVGSPGNLSRIQQATGGTAGLAAVVAAIDAYVAGETTESELGQVLRRHWRPPA